jgi:RimJ/RimL family protein N-acetyltransferase
MLTPGGTALRRRSTPARQVRLPGRERVDLRPIRASDAAEFARAFTRLSERSRHRRFLSLAPALRPDELRYLTAVDHDEHVALVAVDPASEEILGSARYIRLPARPDDAELAIEVIDDWQRRGVGRALLRAPSDHARASGIRRLVAIVSAENFPMQRVLRRAGASPEVIDGELEYAIDPNALAGEQPPRATSARDPRRRWDTTVTARKSDSAIRKRRFSDAVPSPSLRPRTANGL